MIKYLKRIWWKAVMIEAIGKNSITGYRYARMKIYQNRKK
jgi:hypothetical protein